MDVTPQTLIDLNRQFNWDFNQGFTKQTQLWPRKARRVNSRSFENVYAFSPDLPDMRKWVGDRVVRHFVSRAHVVRNDPYELTVDVDRRAIEFDQIGQYTDRFQQIGDAAARWYDKVLTDVQLANPLCYDGQNFYDTDHPINVDNAGLGTFANDFTALPLTVDNLWTLITAMMGFVDENGRNLELIPTLLEVPPALAQQANDALKALNNVLRVRNAAGSDFVAAVPNQQAGYTPWTDIVPLVNPKLNTDPTHYYLHSTNRMMPFMLQVAKEPTAVQSFTAPTDPNVFWQRKFVWGTDADGAAGVTLPFLSIRAGTT